MSAKHLDLILVPLVGYDKYGHRLGMGAGFYDRAIGQQSYQRPLKPFLMGLAHGCQQVEELPRDSWDVPLHAIATDKGLISCTFSLRQTLKTNS